MDQDNTNSAQPGQQADANTPRKMGVNITLGEDGNVHIQATEGMTMVEVMSMITVAAEKVHGDMVQNSSLIMPPKGGMRLVQ